MYFDVFNIWCLPSDSSTCSWFEINDWSLNTDGDGLPTSEAVDLLLIRDFFRLLTFPIFLKERRYLNAASFLDIAECISPEKPEACNMLFTAEPSSKSTVGVDRK